jgi:hypothetical protein
MCVTNCQLPLPFPEKTGRTALLAVIQGFVFDKFSSMELVSKGSATFRLLLLQWE